MKKKKKNEGTNPTQPTSRVSCTTTEWHIFFSVLFVSVFFCLLYRTTKKNVPIPHNPQAVAPVQKQKEAIIYTATIGD
jgi:hypothetical protein